MVVNIDNLIEWLIIEIELSEVQFGLKWYVWFEITSMNLDQNSTTRSLSFCYNHFEIAKFNRTNTEFFSLYKYFIDLVLS